MTPQQRALEDYLADPIGAARERLRLAKDGYARAVAAWRGERAQGGIAEETDGDECRKGVKYRAVTPGARAVVGYWQMAKAELDGAQEQLHHELQASKPTPEIDRRLPRESGEDDDERVPF